MTLELSVRNTTGIDDVEPWMKEAASTRKGMYAITVEYRKGTIYGGLFEKEEVITVVFTAEELGKLDKTITNQVYSDPKPKVKESIVYQKAAELWPGHSRVEIAMRTLGPWAITQYRCNGNWHDPVDQRLRVMLGGTLAMSAVLGTAAFACWGYGARRDTEPVEKLHRAVSITTRLAAVTGASLTLWNYMYAGQHKVVHMLINAERGTGNGEDSSSVASGEEDGRGGSPGDDPAADSVDGEPNAEEGEEETGSAPVMAMLGTGAIIVLQHHIDLYRDAVAFNDASHATTASSLAVDAGNWAIANMTYNWLDDIEFPTSATIHRCCLQAASWWQSDTDTRYMSASATVELIEDHLSPLAHVYAGTGQYWKMTAWCCALYMFYRLNKAGKFHEAVDVVDAASEPAAPVPHAAYLAAFRHQLVTDPKYSHFGVEEQERDVWDNGVIWSGEPDWEYVVRQRIVSRIAQQTAASRIAAEEDEGDDDDDGASTTSDAGSETSVWVHGDEAAEVLRARAGMMDAHERLMKAEARCVESVRAARLAAAAAGSVIGSCIGGDIAAWDRDRARVEQHLPGPPGLPEPSQVEATAAPARAARSTLDTPTAEEQIPCQPGSELVETAASSSGGPATRAAVGPVRNGMGYVAVGHGNHDTHPLGSANAEDAEIRANRDDRVVRGVAGIGVIGQTPDPERPKQIVGVVSLPISHAPNVYAQDAANVVSAIDERINKKKKPFRATAEDKRLIGEMVSEAIHGINRKSLYNQRRVVEWLTSKIFEDMKSKSWSMEKMSRTIEQLCQKIDPKFLLSTAIKLEPMPEGKAARILIADGDLGQVMALLSICCMEDLTKMHLAGKTIKGLNKRAAMRRTCENLRVPRTAKENVAKRNKDKGLPADPGVTTFEGDGSAWDTTCSASLRALTENPIINHISCIIRAYVAVPNIWTEAHEAINAADELTLVYKKKGQFAVHMIDAIRRSGHRGTSCLNWWNNFVLWHVCVFKKPAEFLDPACRYGEDHSGIWRWMNSCFEGDDSALATTPKIEEDCDLHKAILARWDRLGFNMVIFLRSGITGGGTFLLFTGYHLAIDEWGPTGHLPTGAMMPEIDRCFARSGVSTSATMIQFFEQNNRQGCKSVARASALARAFEFSGLAPTVSAKFLEYYANLGDSDMFRQATTLVDRDLRMRIHGDLETEFSEAAIVDDIRIANNLGMDSLTSECERLAACGYPCTEDELSRFVDRMWDYDLLHDWEGFGNSLPISWRLKQ